jgi:hypothetical protein
MMDASAAHPPPAEARSAAAAAITAVADRVRELDVVDKTATDVRGLHVTISKLGKEVDKVSPQALPSSFPPAPAPPNPT